MTQNNLEQMNKLIRFIVFRGDQLIIDQKKKEIKEHNNNKVKTAQITKNNSIKKI